MYENEEYASPKLGHAFCKSISKFNASMKKIKFLLLFVIMCFANHGIAQKVAEDLLKSTIDKIRSYESIEVNFDYRMSNKAAGIDEVQSGKMFLKGNAFRLTMDGQEVICDGTTLWTYLLDNDEVMVSNADQGEESLTPNNILTSYYKGYKVSFVNDKKYEAKGQKVLELSRSEEKKSQKMNIIINEKKLEPVSFIVFDNNENEYTYEVKQLLSNVTLPENFFTFDETQYPNVEVIDMR